MGHDLCKTCIVANLKGGAKSRGLIYYDNRGIMMARLILPTIHRVTPHTVRSCTTPHFIPHSSYAGLLLTFFSAQNCPAFFRAVDTSSNAWAPKGRYSEPSTTTRQGDWSLTPLSQPGHRSIAAELCCVSDGVGTRSCLPAKKFRFSSATES